VDPRVQGADEEVTVVFTGAGTRWVAEFSDPDHWLRRAFDLVHQQGLLDLVQDQVAGVCKACAVSFGVRDEVEASGMPLLSEYKGHQSLRKLVRDGYEPITF
jgi:hypothetical protein